MNKISLFFLIQIGLVALLSNAMGQSNPYTVTVNISGRIDTTEKNTRDIYYLFKNYLESRPDSLYDNPYWNNKEKRERQSGNPAIFYTPLYEYNISPKRIFNTWKPFILSIEKLELNKYKIRVALIKDEAEPDKILTILNLNAIRDNGNWVLENTFHDIVKSWESVNYKYINYVYPKSHSFNQILAQKSIDFCDSIKKVLDIKLNDTFSFYLSDNPDEMGLLFGYEFYYLNYTTGLTTKWLNQIFSAKGNEFYPHEFMHIILKGIGNDSRNYLIEEGLACFLGEFNTPRYKSRISKLSKDYLVNKPTYDLESLVLNKAENNGYQSAYPTGSIIAEIIYESRGYSGIIELCKADTRKSEDILRIIYKITGLNKKGLVKKFREKLILYGS
ncbi:hypothetical protein AEM51_10840 [Bacteroidetes bacterium UKL13-3]|nr:hypothetical protein AEM51_10840 [Bacteroidetes bacterium UKL13-3]HCP94495.1 hypothetical protein [Bacteroidota bacterium]